MQFDMLGTLFHPRTEAAPFQMISDRAPRGFFCVRLGVDHRGEASGHCAPMIKNPRNMPDLRRRQLFDATQSQVVILRSIERVAESTDFTQKIRAINSKMIDKILPEKKLGVPVGFEKCIRPNTTRINLVFVRIDQAGSRVPLNLERDKR